jgi:pimeloyl-ACP methyl ester carboxylesterase
MPVLTLVALVASLMTVSGSAHAGVGRMVDVGVLRLHAIVCGSGRVTTVFESGLGEDASSWRDVQPAIAARSVTVAYDRAGLGTSEVSPKARDARQMVVELHALLTKLNVPKPYVLVGHSLGGYVVRIFAHTYPSEVAGLVLVDPVDEKLEQEIHARMAPEQWAAREAAIAESLGTMPPQIRREQDALNLSGREAAAAWPLPQVPLALLTGTKKNPRFPGNPLEQDVKLHLHDAFLDRIGDGTHILVHDSRHYIQNDDPKAVIRAIEGVLFDVTTWGLQKHMPTK